MLRERLSSSTGATLVLALIFFLLCAVAGSVILIAGSGAAGRLADVKTDQQAYYSATSAAKVLKAEIEKESYTNNGGITLGEHGGALHDIMNEGATVINGGDDFSTRDCEIKCASDDNLDVKFNFNMAKSKVVTIYIQKLDKDQQVEYQCMLTARTSFDAGTQTGVWKAEISPSKITTE